MTSKRFFLFVFPMLLGCGILSGTALAQDGSSQSSALVVGSNLKHTAANRITIAGTIRQITSEHAPGSPTGLHLFVTSPQGVLETSVGPNLTEDVRQALITGQQVQVTGVIETINGHNYLLAHQLTVAGRQISIRNENGFLVHPQSHSGNRPLPAQDEFNGGAK